MTTQDLILPSDKLTVCVATFESCDISTFVETLVKLNMKVLRIDSLLAFEESVYNSNIDVIMVYIRSVISSQVVEKLKAFAKTKFIPIVLFGNVTDRDDLARKFALVYVNSFLDIKADTEQIKNTIISNLPITSGKNCSDILMTNTIRALIRRYGAQEYSLSLVSKALIMCQLYKLKNEQKFVLLSIVKILSLAIKTKENYMAWIGFFNELMLNNKTSKVFNELAEPICIEAKIAMALYEFELSINDVKHLMTKYKSLADNNIYKNITRLYENNALILQSGYDIEMAMETVQKRCFQECAIENQEQFLYELSFVLTKLLLFYNGGIIQIIKNEHSSAINVSSFNFDLSLLVNDFDDSLFEALSVQIDQISRSLNITTKQRDGVLDIQVQNFNFNPVDAWSVKTISAKEYVHSGLITQDDIERLSEILDMILEFEVGKIDLNDVQATVDYFNLVVKTFVKLASLLMTIGGFSAISDGIMRLGLAFKDMRIEHISSKQISSIDYAISAFVSDINEWSKAVFIDKTANDIHFMDMSIISSCQQLIMLFGSHNEYDSDAIPDNDLELF